MSLVLKAISYVVGRNHGRPTGYVAYQAFLSPNNWIYQGSESCQMETKVAFTAHLVRSLARDFPSSQLAMGPSGSFGSTAVKSD